MVYQEDDSNEVQEPYIAVRNARWRLKEYYLQNHAFPTNVVAAIAHEHGFDERTLHDGQVFLYAIRDFQRLALTQDFDVTVETFNLLLKEECRITDEDMPTLQKMYELTKKEANGVIVGHVMDILDLSESNKERLDAAKVLSVLINNTDSVNDTEMRQLMKKLFK